MTQRQAHGIQFSSCPECQIPIGVRGLARHREQAHGVAPATTGKGKPAKVKGLTARQQSLLTRLQEGPVASDTLTDIPAEGLERKGLARRTSAGWELA
jgi:hypothetical protein